LAVSVSVGNAVGYPIQQVYILDEEQHAVILKALRVYRNDPIPLIRLRHMALYKKHFD